MDTTKLKDRLDDKVQALQETAIAPKEASSDSNYIALTDNALDIIRENLKSQALSFQLFDVVKSPSGGSTVFSVPGLSGEEAEKELTGIILDYTTPRAYWDTPDPVEGTPPVCLSRNSVISHDGKACAQCPFNDFGSKDGVTNAKACKESVLIFMLRPNHIIPLLVRVPVTSKMAFLNLPTTYPNASYDSLTNMVTPSRKYPRFLREKASLGSTNKLYVYLYILSPKGENSHEAKYFESRIFQHPGQPRIQSRFLYPAQQENLSATGNYRFLVHDYRLLLY